MTETLKSGYCHRIDCVCLPMAVTITPGRLLPAASVAYPEFLAPPSPSSHLLSHPLPPFLLLAPPLSLPPPPPPPPVSPLLPRRPQHGRLNTVEHRRRVDSQGRGGSAAAASVVGGGAGGVTPSMMANRQGSAPSAPSAPPSTDVLDGDVGVPRDFLCPLTLEVRKHPPSLLLVNKPNQRR